ncbi:MAG TPA: hypothetical protein VGO57_05390 [Verrucomicrobiae bacterium]|jgi:type IV pilus assembly protein PilB
MDDNWHRSAAFGAERVNLAEVKFTPELLSCVPAEFARKHQVMPVQESSGRLAIAMADPSDLNAIDSLCHILNREIEVRVAEASQLDIFIRRFYEDDYSAN